jgi:hypothetical protein
MTPEMPDTKTWDVCISDLSKCTPDQVKVFNQVKEEETRVCVFIFLVFFCFFFLFFFFLFFFVFFFVFFFFAVERCFHEAGSSKQ